MPDPAEMITAIDWAATFVDQLMKDWPEWAYENGEDVRYDLPNQFPDARRPLNDPVYNTELDKVRGRAIRNMCWKLAPDEALILEWEANDLFWMLTNMGVYMNSMDYLYRPVSYSPARTRIDSDGRIRMVMAHKDPGFHNWIDTCGFELGHMCARNNFTSEWTEYRTQVVKHDALADHLPADSARVTPEERAEQMRTRFHSILRRYLL
jgi:hypothetical protein